jgi:hypothetical protein
MERTMETEDIDLLVEILSDLAYDLEGFLKSLVDDADWPKEWRQEIVWKGGHSIDARMLINMAWVKGVNRNDTRFTSLGSILNILLKKVGPDKGVVIALVIVRYDLYRDKEIIKNLKEDKDLLEQLYKIYGFKDFESVTIKTKSGALDTLISEQARNDLVEILEHIIISNEEEEGLSSIKDACRKALPKSQRHHALSINEIKQVLSLLEQYPSARDEMPRIIYFASHLSDDEYIADIRQKINAWFRINGFRKPSVSRHESLAFPEPRLFIMVEDSMTAGLLGSSNQEHFSVQAWLVPNFPCVMPNRESAEEIYKADEYYILDLSYLFSIYRDEIKDYISNDLFEKIKMTEVNGAIHVTNLALSLGGLKELLSLFLSEAIFLLQEDVENFEIGRLAIELFLPERLLCSSDVDTWVVFDFIQGRDYSPIGATFKVLLHNLARFTKRQAKKNRIEAKKAQARNTLQENRWKVNWRLAMEKLQTPLNSDDFALIKADSDFDEDRLLLKLERRIGVVLGQTFQRDELLKSIIAKAGIPIVLWTRYDGLDVDHSSEMHELICTEPLINLPERVFDKRREAITNTQLVSHLGHHLVVLWDDPNRFPPSNDNLKFPI